MKTIMLVNFFDERGSGR
ncbi:heterocyst-inhibiting signaling peptide PatS [Nodularia sphaerocarpa]